MPFIVSELKTSPWYLRAAILGGEAKFYFMKRLLGYYT
jgi:hypothetical protein